MTTDSSPQLPAESRLDRDRIGPLRSWQGSLEGGGYCFMGKGGGATREEDLRTLGHQSLRIAWLQQIHSADLRAATEGPCGTGDALYTEEPGLALCVQTADCVPVLLASDSMIVAIHAGWRGIRSGIIPVNLAKLAPRDPLRAVIGPSIGPCCYEVDEDVAGLLAAAVGCQDVVLRGAAKPKVDLQLAVLHQLAAAGVETVRWVRTCTRCNPAFLWSYRRDGRARGRNLNYIWRERRK